ncbi:MAG: GNAT family N-acetyltransferase [Malacoplasma sp.]|nr:GNAT family N-acetyltransferase [Malacoplasma sp.]
MEIIKDLKGIEINEVINLYKKAFNDSENYTEALFSNYIKNAIFFGVKDQDRLVMITFFIPKRIYINNQKKQGYLIFAVAVDKKYQKQGIMSKYLKLFINDLDDYDNLFFIQAHDWNIYKNFDFIPVTKITKWILRKDQFLKTDNKSEKINFETINKININFLKSQNINNFIYKTEKENKKHLKLYLADGYEILMSNKSYLIYSPEKKEIEKYAYLDLKDFIKLVSYLPYETSISSYIDLDKKFFVLKKEKEVFTKMHEKNKKEMNYDIYFLDNW